MTTIDLAARASAVGAALPDEWVGVDLEIPDGLAENDLVLGPVLAPEFRVIVASAERGRGVTAASAFVAAGICVLRYETGDRVAEILPSDMVCSAIAGVLGLTDHRASEQTSVAGRVLAKDELARGEFPEWLGSGPARVVSMTAESGEGSERLRLLVSTDVLAIVDDGPDPLRLTLEDTTIHDTWTWVSTQVAAEIDRLAVADGPEPL